MDAPLIDPRTAKEIGEQTAQLAQQLTQTLTLSTVPPERLLGHTLAQDIQTANARMISRGTLIDAAILAQLQQIPNLTTIQVQASGWQPPVNADDPDAGTALIAIFSRFAEIVIGRLNQVPEKNFLAFLNLIGVTVGPPQPARVPLSFQIVASVGGSSVEAMVPAGSRVAAAASQTNPKEIVFETEQPLALTQASLLKMYTSLPDIDSYEEQDVTLSPTSTPFYPFVVTKTATRLPHRFYIAAAAFQTLPDRSTVTLTIPVASTDSLPPEPAAYLAALPVHWSFYDQAQKKWSDIGRVQSTAQDNNWQVVLDVPRLAPSPVNGIAAAWLQAQLKLPLPAARDNIQLDAVITDGNWHSANGTPFFPFGKQVTTPQYFYLSIGEAFQFPGAIVQLNIKLATGGQFPAGSAPQLAYCFKKGDEWPLLNEATVYDGTAAFTQDGSIWLQVPPDGSWIETPFGDDYSGYWLGVNVASGNYSQMPEIETMTASLCGQIPVRQIQISLPGNGAGLVPQHGFFNNQPLDLSKDFYPFGQQPAFNDTFYLACDPIIAQGAQAGDMITLTVTLRQAGRKESEPVLSWEFWSGTIWQALDSKRDQFTDSTNSFTTGDASTPLTVSFKLPVSFVATTVNNQKAYWLRVRLTGGDYGRAASYIANAYYQVQNNNATIISQDTKPKPDPWPPVAAVPIYQLLPANYQPPVIQNLQFSSVHSGNAVTSRPIPLSHCLTYNNLSYSDCTNQANTANSSFYLFEANPDLSPALYLGFDRPLEQRTVTLYAQVEPPPFAAVASQNIKILSNPQPPQIVWEYAGRDDWTPLDVQDETQQLARSGLLQFIGPPDFIPQAHFGAANLYWLRARWRDGEFITQPHLRRFLTNTTWARQVTTIRNELLGGSNGQAGQRFQVAQTPVLPGLHLEVREPTLPSLTEQEQIKVAAGGDAITIFRNNLGQTTDIWVRWHEVPDFYSSGPQDRHFTLDRLQGEIRFGDGRAGLIPPLGTNNIRLSRYQTGGGQQGNVPALAVTQLKTSLPYVQSVTNYDAAAGGNDQEPLPSVKRFGPRHLRHRGRAVAAADIEDLAYTASPSVARARTISPQFNPDDLWLDDKQPASVIHDTVKKTAGTVGVVIVPNSPDPQPVPTLALLTEVKTYLQARCGATAQLWVAGPDWCAIHVTATVVPTSLAVADVLVARVQTVLTQFLHPLTGGPDGQGWDFGAMPHESDFYAVIRWVPGVDHIKPATLQVKIDGLPVNEVRLSPTTLIYSGQHTITLTL